MEETVTSLMDIVDAAIPASVTKFDLFPKIPSTYKARSESRGFLTIFVGVLALLLMLNDIGDYIWGWPDYEFSVDADGSSFMNVNVDMLVNMQCKHLSVDLRDAVGDRLFLSRNGFRRDGTRFDIGQATSLREHAEALSAQQAVSQSRQSRGFLSFFRRSQNAFHPTPHYEADNSACRIYGSIEVKKVTANLHVTTLGHGYASYEHVDHNLMNLSHVINEFSFGPYFPDITQPLDYSHEIAQDPFVAYQYYVHVVPTTYVASRATPLHTNQYSVTHYTRVLEHNTGTPGIFFKFEMDPLSITIIQRTSSLARLIMRCTGVLGGLFVCMGYAIRVTTRAVEVVAGSDSDAGLVTAEASGAKVRHWGPTELRSRRPGSVSYSSYSPSPYPGGGSYTGSSSLAGGGTPYAGVSPYSAGSQFSVPTSPTMGSQYIAPGPPFQYVAPSPGYDKVGLGFGPP
ncbi:endoplasmic reticulum-derived transport vesicle ERV46 [Fistulina hepatica ATCC 64428]|uniref:Endoplasmic reticulum-derived transport vesicle ERV46 n=1 Tax=Fistulina hepatica ATCC 64428 TaxID=1128425 RepID=A0A0D7A231_9AGAR|nr:endoplasmic reticulum-derived transport vesicle ERV46 [Fistulina hepatica ATCC 64428]